MTLRPQPTNTRRPADIQAARDHAVRLIGKVCQVAGSASFVDDAHFYLRWHGVLAAIKRHDSAPIFDWLVRTASYHGIADRVATQYMEAHGYMRWGDVATAIDGRPQCPKLASYWQFDGCRYAKTAHTCARPDLIAGCPYRRTRCATVISTRRPTACSCSYATSLKATWSPDQKIGKSRSVSADLAN